MLPRHHHISAGGPLWINLCNPDRVTHANFNRTEVGSACKTCVASQGTGNRGWFANHSVDLWAAQYSSSALDQQLVPMRLPQCFTQAGHRSSTNQHVHSAAFVERCQNFMGQEHVVIAWLLHAAMRILVYLSWAMGAHDIQRPRQHSSRHTDMQFAQAVPSCRCELNPDESHMPGQLDSFMRIAIEDRERLWQALASHPPRLSRNLHARSLRCCESRVPRAADKTT